MTVLTETRERFLLAIAAQVPAERIAEIHFFQPIRQGGVESGVAVVAVWPADVAAPAEPDVAGIAAPVEESMIVDEIVTVDEVVTVEEVVTIDQVVTVDEIVVVDESAPVDEEPESAEAPTENEVERADPRPTIYTARYRLTLKGPDRGKWETHVVAEADAPLVTLEAVVRGVQRRAGDLDEATRMEGDEVRALIEAAMALRAAR